MRAGRTDVSRLRCEIPGPESFLHRGDDRIDTVVVGLDLLDAHRVVAEVDDATPNSVVPQDTLRGPRVHGDLKMMIL